MQGNLKSLATMEHGTSNIHKCFGGHSVHYSLNFCPYKLQQCPCSCCHYTITTHWSTQTTSFLFTDIAENIQKCLLGIRPVPPYALAVHLRTNYLLCPTLFPGKYTPIPSQLLQFPHYSRTVPSFSR